MINVKVAVTVGELGASIVDGIREAQSQVHDLAVERYGKAERCAAVVFTRRVFDDALARADLVECLHDLEASESDEVLREFDACVEPVACVHLSFA